MNETNQKRMENIAHVLSEVSNLNMTDMFILLALLKNSKITNSELAKILDFKDGNSAAYHTRSMQKEGLIDKYTIIPNWKRAGLPTEFIILADADGYVTVMLYKDYPNIKEEDIAGITKIIRNNAVKVGIKDVPIIFTLDEHIKPATGDWPALPSYSLKYRPIIGGIAMTTTNGTIGQVGSVGFAAERDSDNQKGYVTAGHVSFWSSGIQAYQPLPGVGNESGTSSLIGSDSDVAFVPYDNVVGKIHVGGGYTIDVDGYYSGGITSMYLQRSGCVSGVELGDYEAVLTGVTIRGQYMDKVEVMDNECQQGDSGGPVYYTYYGRNKVVGIISAYGTYNNADVTFYIPCSEVTSKLDVTPLEA
ncbi:hypothetical protein [Methanohalophilus portucalensis]|nr:hypothetical protein [Methanohalophilus portucalensis]